MLNVASITRRSRLEDQNFGLLIRDGAMLDTVRNDDELAWAKVHDSTTEFDTEAASKAEKEFILAFVLMPHKGPAELHEFDFLPVELTYDFGTRRSARGQRPSAAHEGPRTSLPHRRRYRSRSPRHRA